ncbi:Holliday junction branch migration protein RuvA [Candidatus Dependentiae bacterium]|nr:MAG: Holliday junction branch migration protein RuvA [Candidatus Dependentiae bacterium]
MLERVSGQIVHIEKSELTVAINGIGLCIVVPQSQIYTLQSFITFYTHLYWHQENGPTLFGFETIIERKFFALLLSCSGIGPKIALAAIGTLGIQQLVSAIAKQDIQVIAQVPGIGIKKAESLAVLLKDKARDFLETHSLSNQTTAVWLEVQQALISLGYTQQEVKQAIATLPTDQQLLSFDQQLRYALQTLTKQP